MVDIKHIKQYQVIFPAGSSHCKVTPSLLIMTGLNCSQLEYPMKCHTKTASTVNLTNLYLNVEIVEAETNILQSNISIFLSLAGEKGLQSSDLVMGNILTCLDVSMYC